MRKLVKPDISIEEALKNPEKWIPEGCYCESGSYLCPFWDYVEGRNDMEDGYCRYLKKGDLEFWEEDGFDSLLWDMCKECGINDEDWMYE